METREVNRKEQKKRFFLFLGLLLALLAICTGIWMWSIVQEAAVAEEMVISLESGFYSEDCGVAITVPKGATVYYTTDGQIPDRESGILYDGPIALTADEQEMVYMYRFKACYEDGRESEVISRTYFVGRYIENRYTTNVLHVTGDPDGLFGYENGIFARGKIFDDWVAEKPGRGYGGGVKANFMQSGDAFERAVYVNYFSKDGTELFSQNCGIRVHGGMTRMKNQKSFRLYARKEYDVQNEFKYPAVSNLISAADGTVAQEHKRLVVRNAGNDNGFAFIRSELTSRLASEAGFPDVMHADPVTVYINGMYYGIYWMENTFDAQYFVNRYGTHTGEFVVLEGPDFKKNDSEDAGEQTYVEEYNDLYNKFSSMDLTVQENYDALCEVLDVENYLQYFAIENYVGNHDWPQNNLKAYRYVSPDGIYEEGTVFDGRYRHLLYDVDYSFGLLVYDHLYGTYPEKKTLERILTGEFPLFSALMERQDCKDYFVSYTCDLMNGTMSREYVEETLAEMHASRYDELYYMLQNTDVQKDSLWNWETLYSIYYDAVETSYRMILEYASYHPETAMEDMAEQFGYLLEDVYTLNIQKSSLSDIWVNTFYMEKDSFTGDYFGTIPVTLTPQLAPNEEFGYWLVNGRQIDREMLVLTSADAGNGQIDVELVVKSVENPVLQINAIRAKGTSDFIEIINASDQPISTAGYFLSDDEDTYKYALPNLTLLPGETKRFYGKDSADQEALGQLGLNFNIKQAETITLTHEKEQLESLVIPDLSDGGIYRWSEKYQRFIEELEF